ncbi:MAG: imidazolonepropionase [Cytophagaceae bacterium]|jgi:imidazolonepropionase|nr:imidazolonepropionase [Cytophagaceae bacterium]
MTENNLLITNIGCLYQTDNGDRTMVKGANMAQLPCINNAFILIKDGKIEDFGTMEKVPSGEHIPQIDVQGKMVMPAWCDSHTHIVYPQSREIEYIDKIKGLSYEDIAKRGGGILNSAKKMRDVSENQLFADAMQRLETMKYLGTGAVEIKSGYGLSTAEELKMLRVIRRLKQESNLTIRATFLGAHAIPQEYKNNRTKYINLIVDEMIPEIEREQLADFVDVFCDKGFFTVEETARILEAGIRAGMRPKIHANELDYSGGIQVGVKYNALSVDHLEYTGDDEIEVLRDSRTMPTVLPGAAFFLGMVYAPVRKMIEQGLPVALATDCNPGSSPSGNMQLIISMGCILYRMLPEEVINAVTLNSAYAMGIEKELGSIAKGKKANIIILKNIPSLAYLPYAYGENKVETVIIGGKIQ